MRCAASTGSVHSASASAVIPADFASAAPHANRAAAAICPLRTRTVDHAPAAAIAIRPNTLRGAATDRLDEREQKIPA
jgi:hypothetical protein